MINWSMAVIWLAVLLVCLVIEIVTLGLATIWFAVGALAATVCALCGFPLWAQNTVFVMVSFIFLLFTRPIAVKYFNKDRVRTNAEGLIGKVGIVISEIDNLQGTGQLTVAGQEWSARSLDDGVTFPVGVVVEIAAIQGVKLLVKERKEGN